MILYPALVLKSVPASSPVACWVLFFSVRYCILLLNWKNFFVLSRYPRRGTNTARGLKTIHQQVLRRARRGVARVLIVMTDGRSRTRVNSYSRKLQRSRVSVYAVGIGRRYNRKQLRVMASSPKNKYVITVGFKRLGSIINKIQSTACKS